MDNTLVIGGGGYLGSKLVHMLGFYCRDKITVVDNFMYNQGPLVANYLSDCVVYKKDIDDLSKEFIQKFDNVINLAALVGMPICNKLPDEAVRINQDAVGRLVDKMSKHQRLIFPCTNSGYGNQTKVCTENTPLNSISIYGKTKEKAEEYVMQHPKATSFRLATVHGVGYRHRVDLMVNYFVYRAACYGEIDLYQGNYNRNFVHINDVCQTFIRAISDENTFGEVFNLGCDEDNTNKQGLVDKILKFFPDFKITYSDKEDADKRNYIVSNKKIKDLNYKVDTTIEDSIPQLAAYYSMLPPINTQAHTDILTYIKNA